MKTTSTILVLIIFTVLFQMVASGQCATDTVHQHLMQTDSLYARNFSILKSQVNGAIKSETVNKFHSTVYTIPIVVHVIHVGEPVGTGSNISTAQIQQAIVGLNNRFRNIIGNGVDVEIEFCLASVDPNGNQTSGINRINGTVLPRYAAHGISLFFNNCDAPSEDSVKDLSKWHVADYYNVWVVNKICQNFNGYVGYANYPNGGPYDGTVIASWAMDSLDATLAHELGHGFFLYHTFEGDGYNLNCPVDTNCTLDGDNICDTPPHKVADCGSINPCTSSGIWNNSRYNYMSYCSLKTLFTLGQKNRMRSTAIVYPRLSLLSSQGCGIVGINNINEDSIVYFYPNPFNDNLRITRNTNETLDISLYDVTSRKIFNQSFTNTTLINTEQLAKGLYLYEVRNRNRVIKKGKVVKN